MRWELGGSVPAEREIKKSLWQDDTGHLTPPSPGRKAAAANIAAQWMPGRAGMRFCIPLQPGQMGPLESRLADTSPDVPAPALFFIALPRSCLEATLHLLVKPSAASTRVFKTKDLYFRQLPHHHQGEQAQLREWLAKAGRRKKHPEGKSRVCRGAETADELLQTTPMLPWDPQPSSKKLCSLLTFPWDMKDGPQLPIPAQVTSDSTGEVEEIQEQAEICSVDVDHKLYLIHRGWGGLLLPSTLLAQLSPRAQGPCPPHL